MSAPCSCGRFVPGQPFVPGRDCRVCWLAANDPAYASLWGVPRPTEGRARRPKPKLSIGQLAAMRRE